ncbi:hypothetical protein CaCOL14_000625 [Colletotrichum acutatum]
MGHLSRSNTVGHGFGILEDTSGPGHYASLDANGPHTFNHVAALEDCDTNSRQRTPEFIDALTDKLKELHIYSPKKNRANRSLLQPARRRSTRSSIDTKIFPTLQHIREEVEICDGNSSVTSPTQGPVLANLPQETKQDEGIPSSTETRAAVPTSPRQTSDSFEANGSNFCSEVLRAIGLEQQHLNTDINIQKSIARHRSATPLIFDESSRSASYSSSENDDNMAVAEPLVRLASPAPAGHESPMTKSAINVSVVEQTHSKESSLDYVDHPKDRVVSFSSTDESMAPTEDVPRTPSRSTSTSSRSRIEDSVEAIDKLEEELEAINTRLTTPSKSRRIQSLADETTTTAPTKESVLKRTASTLNRTQSVGAAAKRSSQARANQRKSVNFDSDIQKGSPGKAPTTRPPVARPTSLLPPKPPAKSTRALTKPSFELPGEATARDIKARRDARLAQQAQEKAAAAAAVPQRTRSLKAPTRPNFELPGEAISRRKREEREARLKQQEEDERRRREFKASPIKARLGTAAQPRETVASRARQNKGSEATDMDSPSKRSSIMGTPRTLARTTSTRSPQTRGRGTSQSGTETQLSRATSTSTGSISGKRSALSVEEIEQQKVKGREVFHRDNSYTQDKERERREREWNAKMAREQAAERSRQASREWREKQQRSKLAILAAAAIQTA